MAYTFADMSFLTAQQKAAAQTIADFGAALKNPYNEHPPVSPVPPLTLSQAKRALEIIRDLELLWGPAKRGANYAKRYYAQRELEALDAANP